MKNLINFAILSVLILSSCESTGDKSSTKNWYKGNLHTHSFWSDGDDFPEMIMDWYQSNDYNFIALSDHNTFAEGEKWKVIQSDTIRQKVLKKYIKRFGEKWVEQRIDSIDRTEVRLKTLEEYRPQFEKKGEFLIIKSEELSDGFEGKPIHINFTNVKELIMPQGGNSIAETMQNNLDKIYEQRERTGQPMFPHINHPNFGWAITPEDIIDLEGERFFEVYNGHPAVNNYGDSTRVSMEELWDQVNTAYQIDNKPLLFGLATDDSHNYHVMSLKKSNPGRGWVMVKSDSLTPHHIVNAMEAGDFYSSSGVTLKDFSVENGKFNIEVNTEPGVNYRIEFIGKMKSDTENFSTVLQTSEGQSASFDLGSEYLLFVRAKVISDKAQENPYNVGDTETAWLQPIALN